LLVLLLDAECPDRVIETRLAELLPGRFVFSPAE